KPPPPPWRSTVKNVRPSTCPHHTGSLDRVPDASEQLAERAKVDVQVRLLDAKLLGHLADLLLEAHEREADPLDLLVTQRPTLHPPDLLALEQLAQELDEGEHELG